MKLNNSGRKTAVILTPFLLLLLILGSLTVGAAPTTTTITEADIGGEWGNDQGSITDIGALTDIETILTGTATNSLDHEYAQFTVPTGGQLTGFTITGQGSVAWQIYLDDAPIDFGGTHVALNNVNPIPAGNQLGAALPAGTYDIYIRQQGATPEDWTITLTAAPPTYSNVTIVAGSTDTSIDRSVAGGDVTYSPTANTASIGVTNIHADLDAGLNVIVNTSNTTGTGTQRGDITVDVAIAKTSGADANLSMTANGGIKVNANITNIGSGDVTLDGNSTGTTVGAFAGIFIENANITAESGNISLTGTGGDSGVPGDGIVIHTGIVSTSGDITVTGVTYLDEAVEINFSSQLNTTGTGNIIINGTSSATSGTGIAVYVGNGTSRVTTVDGDIDITGNATTSNAIEIGAAGLISANGTGNITFTGTSDSATDFVGDPTFSVNAGSSGDLSINADTMEITLGSVIGSGNLTIQPRTAGTTIGLGGGLATLHLSDAELALINDGFTHITIGNSDTSSIYVTSAAFNDPLTLIGDYTIDTVASTDLATPSVDLDIDVRPGESPGIFVVNGNTTLVSDTEFATELGGTTAGNGAGFHDQMSVVGTITIESSVASSVTHVGGFTPTADDTFIIINNDDTDAVSGTFNGLAEGASFMVDGETYVISYVGGDGNDVVLTGNPTPPPTSSPGGVSGGLALWLKANAGTNTTTDGQPVTTWADQSADGHTATPGGSPAPTFENAAADQMNFNPTLNYAAAAQMLVSSINMQVTDDGSIFTVYDDFSGHIAGLRTGAADAEDPVLYQSGNTLYVYSDTPIENANIPHPRAVVTDIPNIGRTSWLNGNAAATELALNGDVEIGNLNIAPGYDVGIGRDLVETEGTGNIAEVIVYNSELIDTEKNQIESYLAIKYGITLTSTQGISYTFSNGSTMWDATMNAAYHNDVAGIAIDNSSALTQTQSMSVNPDALVTISGTIGTDLSALVWGNNDGTTTLDQVAGDYQHMARVWTVAETGTVGNVTVMIPDSSDTLYLLVDSDTDFSNATAYALTSNNGMLSAIVNFTDGQYFTFADDAPPPPNALSLEKTAVNITGAPLIAGDIIEYVVTVTNELGGSQAGIVITDAIPAHTTYAAGSAQVSQGSVSDPDPLVANIGTLGAGASATLTFRVTVDDDANGETIQNSAQASSPDQPEPIEVGPIEPAGGGLVSPSADLAISQSIELDFVFSIFTIEVDNHGPNAAPGAMISVTFPTEIINITWTCVGSGGAVCPAASGSGNTIQETVATFPPGGKLTYTVHTEPPWEPYTNMAEVIPPAGVVDPDMANNQSEQITKYLILFPVVFNNGSLQQP